VVGAVSAGGVVGAVSAGGVVGAVGDWTDPGGAGVGPGPDVKAKIAMTKTTAAIMAKSTVLRVFFSLRGSVFVVCIAPTPAVHAPSLMA
jgi:hypothetical protein